MLASDARELHPRLAILGCAASISGSETAVRAAVIIVDLTNVTVIRPVRLLALREGGPLLQHLLVNIDDVPALGFVVVEHVPRNRMVTISNAQEPAERHHRIGHIA